jgi:hypothetical protein
VILTFIYGCAPESVLPKLSNSCRRAAPISCALGTCENARNTDGYDCASRKHQSIKTLAHLIRQNRSAWVVVYLVFFCEPLFRRTEAGILQLRC